MGQVNIFKGKEIKLGKKGDVVTLFFAIPTFETAELVVVIEGIEQGIHTLNPPYKVRIYMGQKGITEGADAILRESHAAILWENENEIEGFLSVLRNIIAYIGIEVE